MITPLKYIGTSSDGRTNRWRVTCPACKKQHEPRTTLLGISTTICPKCQVTIVCDYRAGVEQARLAKMQ